jgi:hypothetical protein
MDAEARPSMRCHREVPARRHRKIRRRVPKIVPGRPSQPAEPHRDLRSASLEPVPAVLDQDPAVQFERARDGPWTLVDRRRGHVYRSGRDDVPER